MKTRANDSLQEWNRRELLQRMALATLFTTPSIIFAEELLKTPRLTEGPFYPNKLPLDTDNDLIIVNESTSPALGEISYVSGQVLTTAGSPIRNAFVEIWQCDHSGAYLHTQDSNRKSPDSNFQGYGRFLTDAEGRYSFRTIKPVPYPGRTPHIHFAVSKNGHRVLTTQLLIKGHPQNEKDMVFRGVRDPKMRDLLLVDFVPLPDSKIGELTAKFDLVLGTTPADPDEPIKGGIGEPEFRRGRRG
jgi:protocatechuate 3,4-dioxygenase beta subunit